MIAILRAELNRVFNNTAKKKRTQRFAILAMFLSSLFDITQLTDFLHAALNMLMESEQTKEDSDRPQMCFFKKPPKRHTGVIDYPLGMPDTSDTYLTISFGYTQTLLSLDILSAIYAKLAKLLGPLPFPHASQHMLGLSPHLGVSYIFQNQTQASATDDALGSLVLKVDSKFKEIISVPLKDLDVFARNIMKDERSSLDPLLRNVCGWGTPAGTYDEYDLS